MILSAAAVLNVAAAPAHAHHSTAARYDISLELSVPGVLVEMRDFSPHSTWRVMVKGAGGQATDWNFEGVSPTALRNQGIRIKDQIKPGEPYVFYYAPSWNLPNAGLLTAIQIDGRKVTFLKP